MSNQREELWLQDRDGNDIPDNLEHGEIPPHIATQDPRARARIQGVARFLSTFIRVSDLKHIEKRHESRETFIKYLPLFFAVDLIIIVTFIYFVFIK